MAPQAVVVSYRLGGDDGVSVEARKWAGALDTLGFDVRRVAGAIEDTGEPDDVTVPGLSIGATEPPEVSALDAALAGTDLVVVENLCSLPLNIDAARAAAAAVTRCGARVLMRHHDLPWQRRWAAHLEGEFPPRIPGALHVTVNYRSRRELEARKYEHVAAMHNRFDLAPSTGDRAQTRKRFGFADDDLVVFQPARAIERKNVPGGIRFAARLGQLERERPIRYWLSGPAEDGYGPTLDKILERAPVPMTLGRAATAADAYAASDVVVLPSTWEGFGNPTIESVAAHRPCAAYAYPVLAEILAAGVRLFSTDEPEALVRFLQDTPEVQQRYFDVNVNRARISFALDDLPGQLEQTLAARGWTAW